MDGETSDRQFVLFAEAARLAIGKLPQVAAAAWRARAERPDAALLIFDRESGAVVDLDLRGDEAAVVERHAAPDNLAPRRGRPKMGVVAREVTLLPRHWDWLARQPGGASTTLRRLVEVARKSDAGRTRMRAEAAYRFMAAMAGDRVGFEEAARALFAGDRSRLAGLMAGWPADIGDEVLRFAAVSD